MSVRPEIALRLREEIPNELSVIPRSLPVISFGDAFSARVATIALNPSWREFWDKGQVWRDGSKRRLESLQSLQLQSARDLSDSHLEQVLQTSNNYFQKSPYRTWFNPLDRVLQDTVEASFYDATACHLDLVQWATFEVQKDLGPKWNRLVEKDKHFLAWQIETSTATTFVLNGKTVAETLQDVGVVPKLQSELMEVVDNDGKKHSVTIYAAYENGRRFVGWNRTLAYGIPKAVRPKFVAMLKEAAGI